MSDVFKGVEPMVHKSKINVPYHWWAGDTAGKFLLALKNEQKIMGTRCEACSRVYVPPRKNCPVCFGLNEQWVEVSTAGELVSYTVVRRQLAALNQKVPVTYGLIKLDGADTALLHMLGEIKPEDLKIGMRFEAKFRSEKTGTVLDIEYFKPVKG
ncbi:MAG TPA: Zn-ribbon domain-containing OB-fold protein [Spirochaetes bacterium]|nr:Zn-ribbon domain-containing OB-fold protein [Spirochaetota bacterium]